MTVELSIGDFLDRLSILEIKLKCIKDNTKLVNIKKEYFNFNKIIQNNRPDCYTELFKPKGLYDQLKDTNIILWNIEDEIRLKEKNKQFDNTFISLARQVYLTNDKRATIKKQINKLTNSNLIEEKSYQEYN